jgi:hypothetical protein
MVEFTLAATLALAAIVGGGQLLGASWNRFQCAQQVFENAHARLLGKRISPGRFTVLGSSNAYEVRAWARCGDAREEVVLKRLEPEEGQLLLPLILVIAVATVAAAGLWGIMRDWRRQVELQYRLDRCAGKVALDAQANLVEIEKLNLGIHAARAGVAANLPFPPADVPFRNALELLVLRQRWIEARWMARETAWLLRRGCDSRADFVIPLPSFPFSRPPPDPLGSQALVWSGDAEPRFAFHVRHPPRQATAVIEGESNAFSRRWKARWTTGVGLLRTSAH